MARAKKSAPKPKGSRSGTNIPDSQRSTEKAQYRLRPGYKARIARLAARAADAEHPTGRTASEFVELMTDEWEGPSRKK